MPETEPRIRRRAPGRSCSRWLGSVSLAALSLASWICITRGRRCVRRARRRVATRPGDDVLAAFGDDVGFTIVSGKRRRVDAPRTALMFFDDDGKAWPSCSLLVAKLQMRGTRPAT